MIVWGRATGEEKGEKLLKKAAQLHVQMSTQPSFE